MKRSKFSLSHTKLFSGNMGALIPISLMEVLPGDTFQHSTSVLVRCSPLLAPVMHPVEVRIHHWYVPNRLLWEDWEVFITGGPDGMDASAFPYINRGTVGASGLSNHLGVPVGTYSPVQPVSALPFRAYALIYNEFYRDQDLQAEVARRTDGGNDGTTNTTLLNCGWEKDYFTSARPWEQKGPAITIPIGNTAPIDFFQAGSTPITLERSAGTASSAVDVVQTGTIGDPITALADLSGASSITVTALREALALQRFEENRARWGSRYPEMLRAWGVRSSDARLQRPEYLGGGRQTISFSEVLQTAEGNDPVGELRGHGIAAMRSNRYRRFFEEHGYVMSLFSVRPKTIYTNGLARHWNRRFKEDFFNPELQHIGQQEVLNKEVYMAHTTPDGVFGYQDRYDEYRRQESSVSGEFATSVLNYWHLARDFSADPALNDTFVECIPTERIFAVPSQDVLWCMARHSVQARRLVDRSAKSYIF